MSGIAGVLTLYDKDGNPVQVKLVDGEYRLVVSDDQVLKALEAMSLQLAEITKLLSGDFR